MGSCSAEGILISLEVLVLSKREKGGSDAAVAGKPSAVRVPDTGATGVPRELIKTIEVSKSMLAVLWGTAARSNDSRMLQIRVPRQGYAMVEFCLNAMAEICFLVVASACT